ncbi:MAG: response regulator transcription factor [Clostridia bacterium]|nr:response regulator transcription factor [Clostridia bacterium]
MSAIVICDDERDIVSALKIYLTSEGYDIFTASNGKEALEIVRNEDVSLVLLDVMMPVMDGISALAELRTFSNIPVIMLTAKGEDSDKVIGLSVGADDYITKPFSPIELIARVKSQLRRYERLGGQVQKKGVLRVGGIEMDDDQKSVCVDGEPVRLTPIEYGILHLLMSNPGRVFPSAQIYEQVWQEEAFSGDGAVAVHVRHLREKIEIDPAHPRYIKVVWGQGYKIDRGDGIRD